MNAALILAQQSTDKETALVAAIISIALIVMFISMAIALAIKVAICAVLYISVSRIPPEHHKIQPGLIWLLLIPLFDLFWNFFVFLRVPESFQSYFQSQGRTDVGDCGRGVGQWYAICAVAGLVPCVNWIAAPAALVLLIIFLVKAFDLRGKILSG